MRFWGGSASSPRRCAREARYFIVIALDRRRLTPPDVSARPRSRYAAGALRGASCGRHREKRPLRPIRGGTRHREPPPPEANPADRGIRLTGLVRITYFTDLAVIRGCRTLRATSFALLPAGRRIVNARIKSIATTPGGRRMTEAPRAEPLWLRCWRSKRNAVRRPGVEQAQARAMRRQRNR